MGDLVTFFRIKLDVCDEQEDLVPGAFALKESYKIINQKDKDNVKVSVGRATS